MTDKPTISLRDYQLDFVERVRAAYRARIKNVLLVAGTGSGKTVMFSHIARSAAEKGNRVLILAHRDRLIKQSSKKLDDYKLQHGIIMSGYTPNPRRLVQVASVQSLVRRVEKMTAAGVKFDLIVIDEAHLSAAASYKKILDAFPSARVLGVTGSPCRLDGRGLGEGFGGHFHEIVQGITIKELIAQGYLVKPVVYASKTQIDLSSVKKIGGDYDEGALATAMDKPVITGNAIEQYKRLAFGVPGVAWCVNIKHAKHVAEQFNAAGIPAVCLSGEDDTNERDKALSALETGEVKIITFAQLLIEGVDCPAIGAIIMLRPSMSLSSYLQVIGRGLRPIYAPDMPQDTVEQRHAAIQAGPKGPNCIVLDHASLVFRHGMPDEDRDWSLEGVVKKKKNKKEEDKPPPIAQCPKCYLVHDPAPICPGCGHEYEVKSNLKEVDGELALVTEDLAARLKRQRKAEVGRAQSLEELKKIQAERGYREGWADHVYQSRLKREAARPYF